MERSNQDFTYDGQRFDGRPNAQYQQEDPAGMGERYRSEQDERVHFQREYGPGRQMDLHPQHIGQSGIPTAAAHHASQSGMPSTAAHHVGQTYQTPPRPVGAAPSPVGQPVGHTGSAHSMNADATSGPTFQTNRPAQAPAPSPMSVPPVSAAPPLHPGQKTKVKSAGKPHRKLKILGGLAAAVACAMVGALVGGWLVFRHYGSELDKQMAALKAAAQTPAAITTSETKNDQTAAPAVSPQVGMTVAQIAEKASPSVVAINTEETIQNVFGQTGEAIGAGSGVIIRKNGFIATNAHVVGNAQKISVTLANGKEYPAKLVGADPANDLAVVKIDADDLPAITVASSSKLQVGDRVVAIGNSLGLYEGTVTAGVISSTSRNVHMQDGSIMYGALQTDAAINQGNSGGALVNDEGQLVGINSAKSGGEGIAFAIPSDTVMPIIDQLIENGHVTQPELGITGFTVNARMIQAYQMPQGIFVDSVKPGSSADKAGIKKKDIIVGFDGQKITNMNDLNALKTRHKVGDTVKITVNREGKDVDLDLTFENVLGENS